MIVNAMYGAQFLNSEFLMSSCCLREEQRNISIVIPVLLSSIYLGEEVK